MAERPVARGSNGRFARRSPEPDTAASHDARDAREPVDRSTPPPEPILRLTLSAEDVTPAAPGAIAPPPPPGPDVSPEVDEPLTTALAKVINLAIGATAGADYRATDAEVDDVGEKGAPVLRRAAERFGLGEVAGSTMPAWVTELIELGAAVYVAWGDAAALAWHAAVRRARADREDDDDGAPDGQADDADRGDRRRHRGDRRDTPSRPEDTNGTGPGAAARRAGRPGDGEGRGGDLPSIFASIRGVQPVEGRLPGIVGE